MSDNFLSSGWHLPPAAWPYWMPTGPWEEARTTSPPSVAPWGQYPLAPSHSTTPPSSSRGILGNFGQRASSGILGDLGQSDDDWDQSIPPSAQTAAPWSRSRGILGDFGQSVDQQSVDPWLATRDGTAWNASALPMPSALPPRFPPAWSSDDLGASGPDWLRSVRAAAEWPGRHSHRRRPFPRACGRSNRSHRARAPIRPPPAAIIPRRDHSRRYRRMQPSARRGIFESRRAPRLGSRPRRLRTRELH